VAIDRRALKEAFSDTAIATPLNLILNWIFLSMFLSMGMTATEISFAMTAMFFIVAVIRKYYVRQWFKRRDKV
jgi:ABC-type bacteriocin/lantibiotic exporter with double-glycine peptidase domain